VKNSDDIIAEPPKPLFVNPIEERETKKLDELVTETAKTIYEISSAFPFQLFPDKLIIDSNKITIVHKRLFFKHIFPIILRDLNTVKMSRGLVFAALSFEIRSYARNPAPITHLWPEQAAKAESIIIGLLSVKHEQVEDVRYAKLPRKKIREKVEEIGNTKEDAGLF